MSTLVSYALVFSRTERPAAVKTFSHDDIKSLIQAEVKDQYIEKTKEKVYQDSKYPPIKVIPDSERLRILVTGGSGFVGSHLVDKLMMLGHEVIVVDNMFTGRKKNIIQWIGHPHFQLIVHDVIEPIMLEVDQIYHLACPASPPHYQVFSLIHLRVHCTRTTLQILQHFNYLFFSIEVQSNKDNQNEY
jgi:hypothetical protein